MRLAHEKTTFDQWPQGVGSDVIHYFRTKFGRDVSSDVSSYVSSDDCSDVSIDVESD